MRRNYLQREERLTIMDSLNTEQRDFLEYYLRRGTATRLARKSAAKLSTEVTTLVEEFLTEWDFVEHIYIEDNNWHQVGLQCDICNHALREQYTLQNKLDGRVIHYGKDCFAVQTSLPTFVLREVEHIDYELDELLQKIKKAWKLPVHIPDHFSVPEDIAVQLNLELPLLDRQVKTLKEELDFMNRVQPNSFSITNSNLVPSRQASVMKRSSDFVTAGSDNVSNMEKRRRHDIRMTETSSTRKMYFDRCVEQRKRLGQSLTHEELEYMNSVFGKYGYDVESLPGVFGVDVEGSTCSSTPTFLWQLWIYDTFIFEKKTFYSFTTDKVLKKLAQQTVIRITSFDWFYDAVSAYLRILCDLTILRNDGKAYFPTEVQPVSLNIQKNVYLKAALEGHTPNEWFIIGYRQLSSR